MNHIGRSTDFRQSKGDTCIDAPAGNSFDEWGFAQGNPACHSAYCRRFGSNPVGHCADQYRRK